MFKADWFLVLSLISISVYAEQGSLQSCGKQSTVPRDHPLFHNDSNISQYGEFPWMVGILRKEIDDGKTLNIYTCGGSIISKNVILTGANCVDNEKISGFVARVGEWDVRHKNESYPHKDYEIEEVVIHENFKKTNFQNYIALLFLKNDIEFNEKINTVCLPEQNQNFDGKRCVVSGWGRNTLKKDGRLSPVLKKIEDPIVPHDKCQENLRSLPAYSNFSLHESFMCAGGEEGKGACVGDEGSPLVCQVDSGSNQYYQAGIVAWGVYCGKKDIPVVYTNVAHFRSWIDDTIAKHTRCADCVNNERISILIAHVGEWDTQRTDELYPHVDHEVEESVIHENFNKTDLKNNVALLFLKNDIEFNEKINAVCLPEQNQNFDGKRCLVSGWGKDKLEDEGQYSSVLKKIEVPIVPIDKCQENLKTLSPDSEFSLHDGLMCAGAEEGKGVCEGDEGSPLVCQVDGNSNQYYQAGIVGWGVSCGMKDIPSVYTRVSHFRSWIDDKIAKHTRS
ncbi:transmembrane protease serine 9-like [Chironomus tepperi]|uniref:transmembrane protease serine 9-like n=1 Tax=Chironomus tepperi TaxID=113505 RepID=UPI00391F39D0